jgi:hypothetical protein
LLFAGNGAKILDWIWLKKARFLNDFLTDVFLSAVSEDPGTPSCIAVNVGESNCEMKTEVAQGLIANALQFGADGQSENMDAIVLKMNGEDFRYKLKGGPKRARSTLPFVAEKFNNRLQIDRDGNLADMVYTEEIERFIKGFNRAVQKLNEKILRSGESGYQKLTLPQIAWDGINDSNDFIPVNMDDWRNARYSGVVRLTAEDTFIFNGIRNPDNVEEQSLFIIGVKALFGLLTKDFIEFISNSEYRTPPATIPYSREEDEEDDSDAFPGDDEDDEAPIINDDSDEEDIILNRPSRELVIDDEDDDE